MESILKDIYEVLLTRRKTDTEKLGLIQNQVESTLEKMETLETQEDRAKLDWFSEEVPIDLGSAHTDQVVWTKTAEGVFVTFCNGDALKTHFKFNKKDSPPYAIREGFIKRPFTKLYLTNTAQNIGTVGRTLKFIVAHQPDANYGMIGKGRQTFPELLDRSMPNADTEYNVTLSYGTKRLRFYCIDGTAIRYAFVTGKVETPVAPCGYLPLNQVYDVDNLNIEKKTFLYVACGTAGKAVTVECYL